VEARTVGNNPNATNGTSLDQGAQSDSQVPLRLVALTENLFMIFAGGWMLMWM
jgi:hypothetical protein